MTAVPQPDPIVSSGHTSGAAAWAAAIGALVTFGSAAAGLLLLRSHAPPALVCGVIFAIAAVVCPIFLLWDARRRQFEVTGSTLVCHGGVVNRFELAVALDRIGGVTIRQGPCQRLLGCGDVVVYAPGIGASGGMVATTADLHSIRLRSIREFRAVGALLRERVQSAPIRG